MVFMIQEAVKRLFFIIFIGSHLLAVNKDDDVPYIKYAKEITEPFIAECKKKYDLECIGTGGRFTYNIAQINLHFLAYRKGSIEEARILEVKMIENLLNKINSDDKIKPFLFEYPFKTNNLDISISYQKKDDSNYTDGSVALVFLGKNKLFYCAEDPKTGKLVDLLEEPYEEAKIIVNKTK